MKRTGTLHRAFRKALPPTILVGIGFLLFGGFKVIHAGVSLPEAAIISLGLTLVVFLAYFFFGILGYRVSGEGIVAVPRPYAWLIVLIVVLGVAAVVYITLLSFPEYWR